MNNAREQTESGEWTPAKAIPYCPDTRPIWKRLLAVISLPFWYLVWRRYAKRCGALGKDAKGQCVAFDYWLENGRRG